MASKPACLIKSNRRALGPMTSRFSMSAFELHDGVYQVVPDDADRLLEVWEAAVRATHTFLTESDIQFFKPLVLAGLLALDRLSCVRDQHGALVGFVGIGGNRMEALFVHPDWHRAGVGRRLAQYAVVESGAEFVDVNEQNQGAVAFYQRLGFEVEGRSETTAPENRSRYSTCASGIPPRGDGELSLAARISRR